MADAKYSKWTDQVKVSVDAALYGANEDETKEVCRKKYASLTRVFLITKTFTYNTFCSKFNN